MTPANLTELLARSEERDRYERRILAAWREGYGAGELAHADDYERGFTDGCRALKRAQHDASDVTRLDVLRWGPLGREHFADPRPGDYQGGPLPLERPGEVWLAGPEVHYHKCVPACRAYSHGWYSPAEAAGILERLPGDYAAHIARLRGAQ